MTKVTNNAPVFIVGTQRSGTTLLRLLLNSHSQIAIPEEGTFWLPILKRHKNAYTVLKQSQKEQYLKYLKKNGQFKLWCLRKAEIRNIEKSIGQIDSLRDFISVFYKAYANKNHKSIWGDKTPSFFRIINILYSVFPEAKYIHMVRDGRDVYLSWKKLNPNRSNISVSAVEWHHKVGKIGQALASIPQHKWMEVRYEDFVTDPGLHLQRICDFLTIPKEPEMMNFWATSNKFIGKHHSQKIFQPITIKSAYKWKHELNHREVAKYNCISANLLKKYGYEASTHGKFKPSVIISVITELIYGIPLRMIRVVYTVLNLAICSKLGLTSNAAGRGKIDGDD